MTLACLFFFLRFLRFFFFFVGASAESLPEALAVDWTAILLCFGANFPVGAALQQMHCPIACRFGALEAATTY